MLSLQVTTRTVSGTKVKDLREQGKLPAVLYGPEIKSKSLVVDLKEFEEIYKQAGESTLIKLKIKNVPRTKIKPSTRAKLGAGPVPHRNEVSGAGSPVWGKKPPKEGLRLPTPKENKFPTGQAGKAKTEIEELQVLIQDVQRNSLTERFIHADFYQPSLKEKIEVAVPLVFEGKSLAEKELGGVLVKNILELEIRALPQDLPKEIRVDVSVLRTLEDHVQVKDLQLPPGVETLKEPKDIVVSVFMPEEIEEEAPPKEEEPGEEKEEEKND